MAKCLNSRGGAQLARGAVHDSIAKHGPSRQEAWNESIQPLPTRPFALIVLAACSSTTVTSRDQYVGERLLRADRIIVRDFAATPADIAAGSATAASAALRSAPQTAEDIEVGRRRGAQVATEPVADIRNLGLPAVLAQGQPAPRDGDIVITGYFTSVEEGSAGKRLLLGFGSGAAKLATHVEGYRTTSTSACQLKRRKSSRAVTPDLGPPESCPKRDQLPVRG